MPTRYRFLIAFALSAAVFGCAKGNKSAPAKVTGSVTYKGAPVTGGTVVFYAKDAGTYSCPIDADGSYAGSDFPAMEMDVTIETESINPATKKTEYSGGGGIGGGGKRAGGGKGPTGSAPPSGAGPTGPAKVYVKIPGKYAKKDSSKLKATLVAGSNTVDFPLTD